MVRIQKFLDRNLGFLIILIFSLFRNQRSRGYADKRFLLIKFWAIGDAVISLTLVKGIRETFPGAVIDILARKRIKAVFESYEVDRVFYLESFADIFRLFRNLRHYDVVFDCEPFLNLSAIVAFLLGKERIGFSDQFRSVLYTRTTKFRKDQHMVQNYLDLLRKLNVTYNTDYLEKLQLPEEIALKIDHFLLAVKKHKLTIGITAGVGVSSRNRMWPEERFASLADRIINELDADVIFIDSLDNKEITLTIIRMMTGKPLNAVGLFSLREVFCLIGRCDVFISNDTGPMHIAAAQSKRVLGLFGPNTPILWGPYGSQHKYVYKTKLAPAIENDKGINREGNRREYMECIEVEDVYNTLLQMIPHN